MSALQIEPPNNNSALPSRRKRRRKGVFLTPTGLVGLLLINIIFLTGIAFFFLKSPYLSNTPPSLPPSSTLTIENSPTAVTETSTQLPSSTPTSLQGNDSQVIVITATAEPEDGEFIQGLIISAHSDFGYTHLFAFQPETLPFTRLTNGNWDDVDPALSPDGSHVAFSSNRSGQWDLYMLNLKNGETTQITSDLSYDGAPTWSPDGYWLAFEKYIDNNLEIFIVPIDHSLEPIRLTVDGAADHSPAWYPAGSGRIIAFVSNRTGQNDIWLADLDQVDESRFTNLTKNPYQSQSDPAWSPDGSKLAWVAPIDNYKRIFVYEYKSPNAIPTNLLPGDNPVWSPDSQALLTIVHDIDIAHISAFDVTSQNIILPPEHLTGRVEGITWGVNAIPSSLPVSLQTIANIKPTAAWVNALTPESVEIYNRQYTIDLPDVEAPHPKLNAVAIEPFFALRDRATQELGWDVLASLENAFISINEPLPPGLSQSWLYTGRAIALNPTYINAGFMKVIREDLGPYTYWRVFLRTAEQDGSQGRPMKAYPWDFYARFSGNTVDYENGGTQEKNIPAGYWIDFTSLAFEYGWERMPALSNWSSFYPAARFNEFVITSGLDWQSAMLQLYPIEIFITPTPILP
jgi:TolB protein